ncbi:MAG TPA: DolP-mannose mannosyltransferase [Anaerolineae bacterium]
MLGNYVMKRVRAAITGKYWWFVLLIGVSVIQAAATVRALLRPRPLALDIDAALFQHAGWYITQGAIPYVHIWDPTPPLSFLVPALLSLLTGGDPLALHVLSMILTGMVAVAIALLIALLTLELTGIRYAAVIAGYVMFTYVGFYIIPTLGFHFKHFSLLFGLLGLWLALRGHSILAGLVVAASPAFALTGVIFPLLVLGLAWERRGRTAMLQAMGGMLLLTVLVLLPIAYWGAVMPMFQQVIVPRLYVPEDQSPVVRFERAGRFLALTSLFVIVAVITVIRGLRNKQRYLWWVALGGGYSAALVLAIDFDNYPDLFSGLVFVALAVGIFAAQATPRVRHMLLVMLLCALILNPVIRHVTRPDRESSPDVTQIREVNGHRLLPLQIMYWNKIKPETCHYRLSHTELGWLKLMEKRGTEEDCHGIP